MTKPLVQGQIGYWANGKLLHMPKRGGTSKPQSVKVEDSHTKRNRLRREQLAACPRRQERLNLVDPNFHYDIMSLKHRSKVGNLASVLNHFKSIQLHIAATRKQQKRQQLSEAIFFRRWTEYIFVSDIEERTALYYASLTGQHHIVGLYMSLYLISFVRVTESTMGAARTFRGWFSSLNGTKKMILSKPFTLQDYDVCVLNSLNKQVRHILTKQEVTIMDAMTIISKMLEGVPDVPKKVSNSIHARMYVIKRELRVMRRLLKNQRNVKSKKPILNNYGFDSNGKYNIDDFLVEEDYEDYEEASDPVDDTNIRGKTTETIQSNEKRIYTNKGTESINEQDEFSEISMSQDLSVASYNIIHERDFIDYEEDIVEELHSLSEFTIVDDSIFDCSVISLDDVCANGTGGGDDDECGQEPTTQNWDVVSDLLSVDSLDTFNTTTTTTKDGKIMQPPKSTTSYRDMLLKAKKHITARGGVKNTVQVHISKTAPPAVVNMGKGKMKIIIEEGDDVVSDMHWERDGFKNGRGGRLGKLFKSNDFTN